MVNLLLLAGAIAVAILGIVKLTGSLYAGLRRLFRVHDLIERELNNNGGSSMKDGVERINRRLDRIEDRLENLERSS